MARMLYLGCSLLGGWIGWAMGDRLGVMMAFFLSVVGTAAGVYVARRITRFYL